MKNFWRDALMYLILFLITAYVAIIYMPEAGDIYGYEEKTTD